jgi:membrane protein
VLKKIARLIELFHLAARRFDEDRCLLTASSLTFTTLLSLVPIITVALTFISAFPVFASLSEAIEQFVFDNMVPDAAELVFKYTDQFADNAAKLTAVGIAFLGVTAVMLLLTIDGAFNEIWRVQRPRPLMQRLVVYWTLITVGPILVGASLSLTSWVVSISVGWVKDVPGAGVAILKTAAVGLTSLALALLYFFMPKRGIAVKDALIGGVFAGILLEFMKHGFGYYITNFQTYKLVYGAFAAVPVFLMWLYLSWLIVLLGAVIVAALPEWRQRATPGQGAPGSDFMYALQILKLLWKAQQRGEVVTITRLHGALSLRYEHIETLLETMRGEAWVSPAAPAGWVLHRSPKTITVAEIYRVFVFDTKGRIPATDSDEELITLARDYGGRIDANLQLTLAELFENAGVKEDSAMPANA